MDQSRLSERLRPGKLVDTSTLGDDLMAGVVLGIESVPDALASGLLALVNPVFGLNAYMTGKFFGAMFTSSALMSIQTTGALALVVASVPQVLAGENKDSYLFALTILAGVFMLAAGLLKLGRMIRFVPNAVMTGFVNAVALNIILSQLAEFTGYFSDVSAVYISSRIPKTIDLLFNLNEMHLPTLAVGLLTIVLILTLEKTRLGALGLVVAMLASSLLVQLLGADAVRLVSDVSEIPNALPRLHMPPLYTFLPMIIPALSLAFVGLVQGAAITKNFVNPDGSYPEASRDFVGQGVANVAAGLFQGMPVGGSMSATALVANAGARTRLANLIASVVMATVILVFGRLVSLIAMPALAGLLIVIGFRTLKPDQMRSVWRTGKFQRVTMLATFGLCLLIPMQYAVLMGVVLAVVFYFMRQSSEIVVKQWLQPSDRYPIEVDAPTEVPANEVTMLVPYGSLFFATASLFADKLPAVTAETRNAAVILHLQRSTELGSTLMEVLVRYVNELKAHESILMLAGVDVHLKGQLEQTGLLALLGRENVFMATQYVGQSAEQAYIAGQKWVAGRN